MRGLRQRAGPAGLPYAAETSQTLADAVAQLAAVVGSSTEASGPSLYQGRAAANLGTEELASKLRDVADALTQVAETQMAQVETQLSASQSQTAGGPGGGRHRELQTVQHRRRDATTFRPHSQIWTLLRIAVGHSRPTATLGCKSTCLLEVRLSSGRRGDPRQATEVYSWAWPGSPPSWSVAIPTSPGGLPEG